MLGGNLRERNHMGDQRLDGRIIFSWIFRKWDVGYVMMELTHGRNRCQAFENAILNIRVP